VQTHPNLKGPNFRGPFLGRNSLLTGQRSRNPIRGRFEDNVEPVTCRLDNAAAIGLERPAEHLVTPGSEPLLIKAKTRPGLPVDGLII
jgi:hypothetical protein